MSSVTVSVGDEVSPTASFPAGVHEYEKIRRKDATKIADERRIFRVRILRIVWVITRTVNHR